ncbi:MAG: PEP-CTERM sorting domain-containing protein [Opitutales bacterium]|nr:PEP-CTERM sorting domain-containing protein [Opitutales bacterium]
MKNTSLCKRTLNAIKLSLVLISITFFPVIASGSLLAYEGFTAGTDSSQGEYLADNGSDPLRHLLTNQNPAATAGTSFGFNGAWSEASGGRFELGAEPLPSLSYNDGTHSLLTSGNVAYRRFEFGISSRALNPLPTLPGDNLYISFLMKLENANTQGRLELGPQAETSTGTGLRIRAQNGNFVASVRGANTTLAPTDTDTHLFVWRVNFGAGGAFDWGLWMDPTDLTSELAPDFTGSGSDLILDHLVMQRDTGGTDGIGLAFDELRIGETWESVTPIPEPATYGLIGGLLALAAVLRRKFVGSKKQSNPAL